MFDFTRITLFYLKKRLSKHKMTIFSKHFGGHGSCGAPPAYAYGSIAIIVFETRNCLFFLNSALNIHHFACKSCLQFRVRLKMHKICDVYVPDA